LTTRRF